MLSANQGLMTRAVLEGILWGIFAFVIIIGIVCIACWPKEPWVITLKKFKPKHPDEKNL